MSLQTVSNMKYILILILTSIIMSLGSCLDKSIRSRKSQNRAQYPPEKLFQDQHLQAAKLIYEEKHQELKEYITSNKSLINELNSTKYYTLLQYATMVEDLDAMKILLDLGANPNQPSNLFAFEYPLNHAVSLNNFEMLNLLLDNKASLNPTLGNSPLINAMMLGGNDTEKKMIDYLIKNGADVNHISYYGSNILEAAARDNLDITEYLLDLGANPKIKDTNLSPIAEYLTWKQNEYNNINSKNEVYLTKLYHLILRLETDYQIKLPYSSNKKESTKLNIKLYENLSHLDKAYVNLNQYGEKKYQKDLLELNNP